VNAITARRDPSLAVHGIAAKIAGEGAVVRYTPPGVKTRRERKNELVSATSKTTS
jgi:hypothetical protein